MVNEILCGRYTSLGPVKGTIAMDGAIARRTDVRWGQRVID